MKNFLKSQHGVLIVAIITVACLVALLCFVVVKYNTGVANLATQQQWSSGKEEFDKAYEIAASDKESPEKILYVPNLVNQLGGTVDQCVANIGQGAKVAETVQVAESGPVVTLTKIILTNEAANVKSVTPIVEAGCNKDGKITHIGFVCSTWDLGYQRLSFSDIVDNAHLCENTLNDAGLSVAVGSIHLPDNRALYTQYASDGTTAITETYQFSGSCSLNSKNYKWTAIPTYDYSKANISGNLADTVRSISISIDL